MGDDHSFFLECFFCRDQDKARRHNFQSIRCCGSDFHRCWHWLCFRKKVLFLKMYIEQKLGEIIELLSQQDWEEIAKAWKDLFDKAHIDTVRSILEEMTGYYHFRLEKKFLAQSGKPYISCCVKVTEQDSEITGRGASLIQALIDASNQIK